MILTGRTEAVGEIPVGIPFYPERIPYGLAKDKGADRSDKWQEDEEESVRSYWMTLRTGEDSVNWRRKL